jgi:FkbM family methyltransferase
MLLAVMGTYVLEQYRWDGVPEVGVRPGDVVIDGGGCLGDTALYFSHLAGPQGRVHVFEFEPGNVGTLRANLELNPELATRIDVVEQPLWHRSGETMRFDPAGPSTRLGAGTQVVETAAIDALVAAGRIDRVDFLKLDIEGAELQALEGARETITRFRPRLALSVYHREDDLIRIPAFVEELGLGYRFALGHYTAHAEETILFAWTDEA